MFTIDTKAKAKLSSVNVRSELHGKDHVTAVDLKFTMDASNDVLSAFHPMLRSFLYAKSEASSSDTQQSIDGVAPVSDLPNLRFPKLSPLAWDTEQTGMGLTIDYGLGGASNLELSDCTANAFKIAPKEGGTCEVSFRIQRSDLDEKTLGKLATLVQHDVEITLAAPEVTQEDIPAAETVAALSSATKKKDVRQTPAQALAAQLGQTVE